MLFSINCLEVPANSIIRFNVTSVDNLHAFYLPDMGIKQDAVPGLNTATWVDTSIVSAEMNLTEYTVQNIVEIATLKC